MRSPRDLTFAGEPQSLEELRAEIERPIPEGSMRVAPGSDAVVWLVNPRDSGEL